MDATAKDAEFISQEVRDCWLVRAYLERAERERRSKEFPLQNMEGQLPAEIVQEKVEEIERRIQEKRNKKLIPTSFFNDDSDDQYDFSSRPQQIEIENNTIPVNLKVKPQQKIHVQNLKVHKSHRDRQVQVKDSIHLKPQVPSSQDGFKQVERFFELDDYLHTDDALPEWSIKLEPFTFEGKKPFKYESKELKVTDAISHLKIQSTRGDGKKSSKPYTRSIPVISATSRYIRKLRGEPEIVFKGKVKDLKPSKAELFNPGMYNYHKPPPSEFASNLSTKTSKTTPQFIEVKPITSKLVRKGSKKHVGFMTQSHVRADLDDRLNELHDKDIPIPTIQKTTKLSPSNSLKIPQNQSQLNKAMNFMEYMVKRMDKPRGPLDPSKEVTPQEKFFDSMRDHILLQGKHRELSKYKKLGLPKNMGKKSRISSKTPLHPLISKYQTIPPRSGAVKSSSLEPTPKLNMGGMMEVLGIPKKFKKTLLPIYHIAAEDFLKGKDPLNLKTFLEYRQITYPDAVKNFILKPSEVNQAKGRSRNTNDYTSPTPFASSVKKPYQNYFQSSPTSHPLNETFFSKLPKEDTRRVGVRVPAKSFPPNPRFLTQRTY